MQVRDLIVTVVALIFITSCGEKKPHASELFEAVEDHSPVSTVDRELGIEGNERYMLRVSKDALDEPFLLAMSTIPQKEAATSTGLAAKVVTFKQFGDTIDMYEINDGNVVTDTLPAQTLLAQFPVKSTTNSALTIDFDAGMKDVYTTIWYGGSDQFTAQEATLDIRASRVFAVERINEQLLIRHAVLARASNLFGTVNAPVEIRYYLSRYEKSDFQSKEVGELKNVGFFGGPVKLEKYSGRVMKNALRFDVSQPIVFHYSANTPDEYVAAVQDGVLYWNKAFGSEVVRVEKAPEGVTAPDPRYNVIQWVEWDEAGFAYADVLADPLTGESLHGQVFMTSVFAFKSKERVRKLIRLLSTAAENEEKNGLIVPNFARPAVSCHQYTGQQFSKQLMSSMQSILASDEISEETILKVSQDYVREVIAHEVGHVLGLRHNFAGSDDGNMTPKDKRTWLKQYLRGQATLDDDKFPVTTVMDYSTPIDAYYVGWYIRQSNLALPYDKDAIQWGYFDDDQVLHKKGLFCTDEHVALFSDCNRFDQGPSVADVTLDQIAEAIASLPVDLLEYAIAYSTAVHPSQRLNIYEQVWDPEDYAKELVAPIENFIIRLDARKRLVAVDREYEFVGPLNEDEIYAARWRKLKAEIEAGGGVESIMFNFLPGDLSVSAKDEPQNSALASKVSASSWYQSFESALESETYNEFIGADGKKYSFTDDEKNYLKKQAKNFFGKVESAVVKEFMNVVQNKKLDLGTVANGGVVRDEDVANKIQSGLVKVIDKIVTTQASETSRITGTLNGAGVWVKRFRYDIETRELAAATFNTLHGNFLGWSEAPKKALGAKLKASVHGALNIGKINEFDPSTLSPSIMHWYKNQQRVGMKLGAGI